jgi:hypothetical protein
MACFDEGNSVDSEDIVSPYFQTIQCVAGRSELVPPDREHGQDGQDGQLGAGFEDAHFPFYTESP